MRNWSRIWKQGRGQNAPYAGRISFTDETAAISPGIIVRPERVYVLRRHVIAVATARDQVVFAGDDTHFYANGELSKRYPVIVNVPNYLSRSDWAPNLII